MEEKTQATERETKKDEVHEKDTRNKRYMHNMRLFFVSDCNFCLTDLAIGGNRTAPLFLILTYIRPMNARWKIRDCSRCMIINDFLSDYRNRIHLYIFARILEHLWR